MVLGHLQRVQLNVQNAAPTHVSAVPAFTAWEPAPSPLQGSVTAWWHPQDASPGTEGGKGGFRGRP